MNVSNLQEPGFKPRIGDQHDSANYTFRVESFLSSRSKSTLRKWINEDSFEGGDLVVKSQRYAEGILDAAAGNPKNIFHSIAERNGEIIGISQFRIENSSIAKVSLTASDPINLSESVNKISGFGAKLKYTGLDYLRKQYPSVRTVISNAKSFPSAAINLKLGFFPQ